MSIYKIIGNGANYEVFSGEKKIFYARRKYFFLRQEVDFYNFENEKIAIAKLSRFFMFELSHTIEFLEEKNNSIVIIKNGIINITLNEDLYESKYDISSGSSILYFNKIKCGVKENLKYEPSYYEHKISCENERLCFIFSIMDIVLDNFD